MSYEVLVINPGSTSTKIALFEGEECLYSKNVSHDAKELEIRFNIKFDLKGKHTYDAVGCSECNYSGYYDRIGIFEILTIQEKIKELLVNGGSSIEIRNEALKGSYKPLIVDGINKVLEGHTNLNEIDRKLVIY